MVKRRYTIIHSDGEIETKRKPKIKVAGGKRWAMIGPRGAEEKYAILGPWNFFLYRSWQSFGVAKRMGFQKIWFEGNPTAQFLAGHLDDPLDDSHLKEREKILDDTARAVHNITEFDNPEKLMRPRKTDWVLALILAVAAFGIGMALGGRV